MLREKYYMSFYAIPAISKLIALAIKRVVAIIKKTLFLSIMNMFYSCLFTRNSARNWFDPVNRNI